MAIGTPRKRHHRWKFLVEVDNFNFAGFQRAGPLEVEAATVAISEGGSYIPYKSPGRVTFSKITLERGATFDSDIYAWFQQTANAAASSGPATQGVGDVDENLKRNISIVQQDRNGETLKRWAVANAFCCKFVAGDWDNESDEFTIESAEIDFDWFELVFTAI